MDGALDAALLTFWRQGYRATSMDDLVAATGASRASLYKTFGDKEAIFLAALDLYGVRFRARVDEVLAGNPPFMEAVRHILTASAERLSSDAAPAGCLRCNSTLELMGSDAGLDAALDAANAEFERQMRRLVDHARQRGEVADRDADTLTVFLTGTVAALVTLARSGFSRDRLFGYLDTALATAERFTR